MLIGTYEYDLWGNPISVKEAASGRDTDGILQKNPFRYRCYYYDVETGFYYLNARYYDPQTRRFISADDQLAEIGASVIGYNLYAYCDNSPVGAADYDGHCAIVLVVAGVAISVEKLAEVVLVGLLAYMVYDYYKNPYNEQNPVAVIANTISNQVVSIRNAKEKKKGENVGTEDTGETEKGIEGTDEYYKKGLKEVPNDWVEVEAPEELPVKSKSFKEFLSNNGHNPKKWKKIVEKWASSDGTIYQRNYWTNGTDYYYHGDGIEEFFPH